MQRNLNIHQLNEYINASIYIPRIGIHHTEETVRKILAQHGINGVVSVDFTNVDKKNGFHEKYSGNTAMSAFVHIYEPFYDKKNKYSTDPEYVKTVNQNFWYNIFSNKQCTLYISPSEYWICLRNRNPVPRTFMNIHQVVENGRYVEDLITKQGKIIEVQNIRIQELEKKLQDVNQQLKNIDSHISDILFGVW